MKLSLPRPFFLGLLAGAVPVLILGISFPREVEVTRVEWKTKVVTEVKEVIRWKEKVVTKWKTRTVTKPDGTTIVETCQIGSQTNSTTSETSATSTSTAESTTPTTSANYMSRYRLGAAASWEVVSSPYDIGNYRLTGEARVGNLPLWAGVWVQGDLSLGVGLSYEF